MSREDITLFLLRWFSYACADLSMGESFRFTPLAFVVVT